MKFLPDKRLYSDTSYCLSMLRALQGGGQGTSTEVERYHFYWKGPFGRKQAFALKSLLATQQPGTFELWLWLDQQEGYEGYADNALLRPLLPLISVKRFVPEEEAKGTPLEGRSEHWERHPVKRSNFFRHLILFKYGGTYLDIDTAILRDLRDLRLVRGMQPEFSYQWSNRPYGNSAVLRLRKESRLALELLNRGRTEENCEPRKILQFQNGEAIDLLILPVAFFDPLWLFIDKQDNSFQAPFSQFKDFFRPFDWSFRQPKNFRSHSDLFPGAFAYHWHNQWNAPEPERSFFGVMDSAFQAAMSAPTESRTAQRNRFQPVMNRALAYLSRGSSRN